MTANLVADITHVLYPLGAFIKPISPLAQACYRLGCVGGDPQEE
jgi:hypothetical protein